MIFKLILIPAALAGLVSAASVAGVDKLAELPERQGPPRDCPGY